MPEIDAAGIIRIKHGEAVMIVASAPVFLSPEREVTKKGILAEIETHIQRNWRVLKHALSGEHDDVEAARTELDPGFARFVDHIHNLGISPDEIRISLERGLETADANPFQKRQLVKGWTDGFDYFQETLPQANNNNHSNAA